MQENSSKKNRIYAAILPAAKTFTKALFNYEFESLDCVSGPVLLLSNHNTDFDFLFLALAARRRLNFVATENITRMGILGKIASAFDTIPHYKGTRGISTTKTILTRIREGCSVAMFPEGNRSFSGVTCPIPPATAKLAKASGAALVTYRLTGGYFSSPRWGKGIRRGKIRGSVAGVYTPENLKAMSVEDVRKVLESDLYTDAYEEQKKKPVRFRGKKRAEGLESTLFMCPVCGKIGSMKSSGSRIFCSCGFDAALDEFGWLNCEDGRKLTITELDNYQRQMVRQLSDAPADQCIFSDSAVLETVDGSHRSQGRRETVLRAFSDRFETDELTIPFSEIEGIAINRRNLLLVHVSSRPGHLEISGPSSFSALKYLYLFRAVCGSENGVL